MDDSWPRLSPRTEIGIKKRRLMSRRCESHQVYRSDPKCRGSIRFAMLIWCFSPTCPARSAVAFIDVALRGHCVERAKFSRNALHGAGADTDFAGHFQNALTGP